MRKLMSLLAVLLVLAACNSQPSKPIENTTPSDTVPDSAKHNSTVAPPTLQLLVEPATLTMVELPQMRIGVKVWNRTDQAFDPQLHMFQLEVNGERSKAFSLAASNGKREAKWFDLPAGDSVDYTWPTLALSIFKQPGEYRLQLKTPLGDAEPVQVILRK